MATAILKTCATCGQNKPTSEFNVHRRSTDGLRGVCKACQKLENRASYLRHQEKRQAEARAKQTDWRKDPENAEKNRKAANDWYRVNGEHARAAARRWALENPEKKKQADRLWALKSPEKCRATQAAWRAANPERKNASDLRWTERNRQKTRERARTYIANFPERHAARQGRRRANKLQATPAWADLEAIAAIYRQAREMTLSSGIQHHVDHFYPLNGRLVCGLHHEANLQVIPWVDNLKKGNRLPVE